MEIFHRRTGDFLLLRFTFEIFLGGFKNVTFTPQTPPVPPIIGIKVCKGDLIKNKKEMGQYGCGQNYFGKLGGDFFSFFSLFLLG